MTTAEAETEVYGGKGKKLTAKWGWGGGKWFSFELKCIITSLFALGWYSLLLKGTV